jgi:hypothetical protein
VLRKKEREDESPSFSAEHVQTKVTSHNDDDGEIESQT